MDTASTLLKTEMSVVVCLDPIWLDYSIGSHRPLLTGVGGILRILPQVVDAFYISDELITPEHSLDQWHCGNQTQAVID